MAKVLQPVFIKPSLQISPRIHARRSMPLEVNKISGLVAVLRAEEVIESNLQQRSQRRVSRDMPANSWVFLILTMHHRHRIPSQQRLHPFLQLPVAGIRN